MTMKKTPRTIGAGEFKAKCLALFDEISESGRVVVVTKRGRPVVRIEPVGEAPSLKGSIVREGDLVAPLGERWTVDE